MPLICILGRQPALSLAELESFFGSDNLSIVREDIAQLETSAEPATFDRLGGVQKVAKIVSINDSSDWNKVVSSLNKIVKDLLSDTPDGKVTLGISTYGMRANPPQINAAALSLKKVLKANGRAARIVPNKEPELNTAQVLHNKLASDNGIELLLIRHGSQTIIARTGWVQDIEAYRRRDQERPFRDSRVGMLPPKLAQIIINLALGFSEQPAKVLDTPASLKFNEPKISDQKNIVLLDPFCGTGVLLQEALLMGMSVLGTDLEPRMVEYSQKNLEWLGKSQNYSVEVADATKHTWEKPFQTIACETFLGRPLTALPDQQTLLKIIHDCNVIHKKFLQNAAAQTESGFRMCIAVPAWRTKSGFKRLPLLDHLEELGYNRVSFERAANEDLVYHREGQIVARELVVLKRI